MRSFIVQVQHDDPIAEQEVARALRMLMQAVALNDVDVKGAHVVVLDAIGPQPPAPRPTPHVTGPGDVVK